jgi:multisubunit Na+/H+ antiporter MnhC subunit
VEKMYISIVDLGVIIGIIMVIVVGLYTLITLKNINGVLSRFTTNMEKNEKNIEKTIGNLAVITEDTKVITESLYKNRIAFEEHLPNTVRNLSYFSNNIKETSDQINATVDIVNTGLMDTVTTVRDNTGDIIMYMKIVSEGIHLLLQSLGYCKNNKTK